MQAFGALGLALLGCTDPVGLNPTKEGPVVDTGDTEVVPGLDTGEQDPGGPDPVSDPLFEHTRVHEVRIELSADSEAALTVSPSEYAAASVTLDGERLDNVGLRIKGNNSFRPITEKPSFKVRLDEFVGAQTFGRLRGVTLNNMIEDPSFAREMLTYWLWNDAGMPASRAAYTRVYVNDTYFGLYLLLESADKAFVQRRFPDASGDLWEGEDEADFTAAGVQFFDHKAGEGEREWLEEIAGALAEPTDDFYASADRYFQMDQVLDYWAWTMATANLDAYPYNLNDYVLYADPAEGGRLTMSPWGMDESWNPAFTFQWGRGVALFGCAADNACLDRVIAHTEAALEHCEGVDVPAQLQAFYDLSAAAIAEDVRAGWSPLEVDAARAELLSFTARWPDELRAQMHGAP